MASNVVHVCRIGRGFNQSLDCIEVIPHVLPNQTHQVPVLLLEPVTHLFNRCELLLLDHLLRHEVASQDGTRILLDLGMPLYDESGDDYPHGTPQRPTAELIDSGILPKVPGLYASDSTTPDSRALLFEADGQRLLYSRDLRAHGRTGFRFDNLLEDARLKGVGWCRASRSPVEWDDVRVCFAPHQVQRLKDAGLMNLVYEMKDAAKVTTTELATSLHDHPPLLRVPNAHVTHGVIPQFESNPLHHRAQRLQPPSGREPPIRTQVHCAVSRVHQPHLVARRPFHMLTGERPRCLRVARPTQPATRTPHRHQPIG